MQLPAWHSCPASPPQTASCFPCHFPGGGHLSGQLLSLLCLSRPHPFSPSSHPGTEQFMQWLNRLNTPSTLTTESFKKKPQTSEGTTSFPHLSFRCSCTPAIEVFREVCVWWEAGVCVPVEHQKKSFRENSDEPSLGLWNSCRSNHLLREGELGWYFWCCYHFCNIFWRTSTKDWRVIFKQYQTVGLACDL